MSYASIMVHEALDGTNDARLEIAVGLAKTFNAKLIGVAACAVNPPAYGDSAFAGAIIEELRQQAGTQLQQVEERFRSRAEGDVPATEWRQAFAKPTTFVAQQARAADLVVTGSVRDDAYIDPFTQLDPAGLIMDAGRPVLIVPPQAEQLVAARVVVAWKDTREARRAVVDALPLLRRAADVTVAEIADRDTIRTATKSGEDVAAWLKRHGVCATANAVVSTDAPVAALEALLLQNAADLVVAGAYGHSRLQEWIFGGFTRDLLANARCCCLFSN